MCHEISIRFLHCLKYLSLWFVASATRLTRCLKSRVDKKKVGRLFALCLGLHVLFFLWGFHAPSAQNFSCNQMAKGTTVLPPMYSSCYAYTRKCDMKGRIVGPLDFGILPMGEFVFQDIGQVQLKRKKGPCFQSEYAVSLC